MEPDIEPSPKTLAAYASAFPEPPDDESTDFGLIGPPECQAKLVTELAAARMEFENVEKSREGQYGNQKFRYAQLGVLTGATAPALAKHGIFVAQGVTTCPSDRSRQVITTRIMGHGAQLVCSLTFDPRIDKGEGAYKGEPIKEWGKLSTYMRRYQYQTLLVLDAEPDADEAPAPEQRQAPRREPPRAEARPEAQRPAPRQDAPAPQAPAPPVATLPPPAPVSNANPVTPKPTTPEPQVTRDADQPADTDMVEQLRALYVQLGLNRITYSQLVEDVAKIPAAELKHSARAAHAVMERMQRMVLDQQQQPRSA